MSSLAGGTAPRRATVVGAGLIGGSIGMALRAQGWHVCGHDLDSASLDLALACGAIDEVGVDEASEITFVATPLEAVEGAVRAALKVTSGVVTDVAGVKAPLVELMAEPRFVGGHPMAGSERDGVGGARVDLFNGAAWVLTPVAETSDVAFALVRSTVSSFGAEVIALPPGEHDRIVAVVSHVPHLTAATLMSLADEEAEEHRALLRMAAGGFRDMTRVASGTPAIWPDVCFENRTAIVRGLDQLIHELGAVRDIVAARDRAALLSRLEAARSARRSLPTRVAGAADLVEVRLPLQDEAGALVTVLLRAAELGVSVADVEIAHSVEGDGGVLVLVVEARPAQRFVEALAADGRTVSVVPIP